MQRRVIIVLGTATLLCGGVGLALRFVLPPGPMPEATAATRSDERVLVLRKSWWEFQPAAGNPRAGLIFYPGAFVDPVAYAPAARALAERGYFVALVPMPLGIPLLGVDRAAAVIAANPAVPAWAVGGHSLGGVAASAFTLRNPDRVAGLVLWASYPNQSDDLSRLPLEVVSVYGELDPLSAPERVRASQAQLPPTTQFVEIRGGNHAQFGWYGEQFRDRPALISRDEQQRQAIAATEQMLSALARSRGP
ncbi:MAG: alpha/beta hydrolase [Chloroflexota bacterium]|nr:alpha/beta hydrolase [Dehalococcoidia bacterium]MDW8254207.1 alpha/beta hydrolase [Chloroflexota bacterium]